MFFYNFKKKIRQYLKNQAILYKSKKVSDKEKILFIDVSGVAINRYLYCFLKMFDLAGYTVYLPRNAKVIEVLSKTGGEYKYASWLIKDEFVKFGMPPAKQVNISISSSQLSNDYFSNGFPENSYHVPMSCYPGYYQNYQVLYQEAVSVKRKNSAFMSGNIDPAFYDKISDSKYFIQPSRKQIKDYLVKQNYYFKLNIIDDLFEFINGKNDKKVIIVNTLEAFRIDLKSLPSVLKSFNFYLAMPGIVIPQSHNLIEAMACGCIPIIHAEYAKLMRPCLIHNKNSFVFENLTELDDLMEKIFSMPLEKIEKMREEVFYYYNTFLSPKSIVSTIESKDFDKIYIQAENLSLKMKFS